jgi:nucleoredoxin
MKTLLSLLLLIPFTTFASLEELVGPELINAAGEKVPTSSLAGKVVGLYFSAEWCPPCKAFTPELVKLRDSAADKFEVVFVSSDRSPEAQQKYMKDYKMIWLAVPHDSAAARTTPAKIRHPRHSLACHHRRSGQPHHQ